MSAVQQALGLGLTRSASFETFYPGDNAALTQQLRDWATGDDSGQVFLVGPRGSGKTHLAQAVCRQRWEDGRKAAYLPLSQVSDLQAVIEGLSLSGIVAIDDLEALAPDTELTLMRLIDASRAADGRLLFAAPCWPQALQLVHDDLRSRLQWGAVFELQSLDDAGLAGLLRHHCRLRGVEMDARAIDFLLKRLPRSPDQLLAVLDKAYDEAVASRRGLTIPLLREVLQT